MIRRTFPHHFGRLVLTIVAVSCWGPASLCFAVAQRQEGDGFFIEAEDYGGHVRGESFGLVTDEPAASGGKILLGMYRDGMISYRLSVPDDGRYTVWMRCAAPGEVTMRFGFDTIDDAKLLRATVSKTADDLTKPGAYQWRRLGVVDLTQGERVFVVGQGPLRPDCFFFTQEADFTASDEILAKLEAEEQAPKGHKLPELVHRRKITKHPEWLKHALRSCYAHFEWDPKMTADEWCRRAASSGANCIFGAGEMPAGTIDGKIRKYSYATLARNPKFQFPENYDLSYGWVKEYADAAHRRGLKIAIYGGAFRSLDPLLVEHPEWRQVDARGRPFLQGFGSWHSPYREAYIRRWVDVARNSGLDGIMIDMLFTGPRGGDYSDYTIKAFRKRFGVEPPREPDPRNLTWQRWIDFQSWTREEMLLDLTEALHAVNPEIAVTINQTVGWIFDQPDRNFLTTRVADCVDGLLEEMGWEYRHRWERPWAWPASSAWQNLFLRSRTRPGYGQMWHLLLNYPETHVRCLWYSMLANGTAPGVVTGSNWPVMSRVWQHTKACEPWIEESELVPWMAIHFGEDTLRWYANAQSEEAYTKYLKNVFGFFQAALELHLPIEIITDDDLADADVLGRYATVLLPNSACLSDAQAAALEQYVSEGGGLVASLESGCYDENGTRRSPAGKPALEPLFGVTQYGPVESQSWSMPLHEIDHPILDDPEIQGAGLWRQGWSEPAPYGLLFSGPVDRTVRAVPVSLPPKDAASVRLSGEHGQPAGTPKSCTYKTFVARQYGRGKVVLFPIDLGHAFFVFNHPLNRQLVGQALRWTASRPAPLRTNAPSSVETVLYEKEGARIVHVVNDVSSFGRAAAPNPEGFTAFRNEVVPVGQFRVAVEGAYRDALLLPEGRKLDVRNADGFSEVEVPGVEIHGMVVFQR